MSYNFEDFEDFVTDEDLLNKKKKKKVNGKKKGNRTELELTKILNKRFGTGFSRSVGSGNRWSQTNHMPKHAQEIFSGDLIAPLGFKFVLESKGGYEPSSFKCTPSEVNFGTVAQGKVVSFKVVLHNFGSFKSCSFKFSNIKESFFIF